MKPRVEVVERLCSGACDGMIKVAAEDQPSSNEVFCAAMTLTHRYLKYEIDQGASVEVLREMILALWETLPPETVH